MTAALNQITDEASLRILLRAVVQAENLAAFQAVLDEQQQQAGEQSDNGAA
jgi:hypothetical protein